MTLLDGWLIKKANPDAERNHLNKILQNIRAALDAAIAGGINTIQEGDGINVNSTDSNNPIVSIETTIMTGANEGLTAVQPGDNVSVLVNDAGYTTSSGSVTSVAASVPTGFDIAGSPVTTSGTLTITYTSGYSLPTTASQTDWDTAYTERHQWDGGNTNLTASTGRTSLGGTTVGQNFFTLTDPSAIRFARINADNTIDALSADDFRAAIGAGGVVGGTVSNADLTVGLGHVGGYVYSDNTSNYAWTIPPNSTTAFALGDAIMFVHTSTSGTKTVTQGSGVSFIWNDGGSGNVALTATSRSCTAMKVATDTWLIY